MKTVTQFPVTSSLSNDELAALLGVGADAPVVERAQTAVQRASAVYLRDERRTSGKQLGRDLDSIKAALDRLQRTLGRMDAAHLLDEHYCTQHDGDVTLMRLKRATGAGSGFEAMATRMSTAVAALEADARTEGKGQGRDDDETHTLAVMQLVKFCRDELPNMKITSTPGSRFTRLVAAVLSVIDPHRYSPESVPRAAIDRAVEHFEALPPHLS